MKKLLLANCLLFLSYFSFGQLLDDSGNAYLINSTSTNTWDGTTSLTLRATAAQTSGLRLSYEADSNPRVGRIILNNNWGGIYGDFAISLRSGIGTSERFRIRNNGNVGIGTSLPSNKLHLSGLVNDGINMDDKFRLRTSSTSTNFVLEHIADDGNLLIRSMESGDISGDLILNDLGGTVTVGSIFDLRRSGTGNNFVLEHSDSEGNLILRSMENDDISGDLILNDLGGNIGIGTTTPNNRLHMTNLSNDGINMDDKFRLRTSGTSNTFVLEHVANTGNLVIRSIESGDTSGDLIINDLGGNVGIGTSIPDSNYKLSVNGAIRTKEVKVEANWADFVFYDDYKLPSLEEVEKHISEKGHLSEIPSEKEVAENGINLGEMDAKLLQKIEELTLYLIEQNKENKKQRLLIESLQDEIAKLKTN